MNEKVKSIFLALGAALGLEMKDTKVVTDIDGNDIVVETEGDITEGCKAPQTADGAYKLPDGRTLIVKEHTIEKIEVPADPTKTDDPDKGEDGNGEDGGKGKTGEDDGNGKGGNTDNEPEPEPDEKDKKIADLEAQVADLQKQLEEKDNTIANLNTEANAWKAQKAKFDGIEKAINEAGGIDAVLKACSVEPKQQTAPANPEDAYERFKKLSELD